MTALNPDPTGPDSTPDEPGPDSAAQLTASPARVSRTYVSDHVLMMDVPDNALRMWLILRAFIYEKDPTSRSVRITDDELATLMHRSVGAVRKIRKTAYGCGLLAEESCVQESYRAANGQHRLRTVRRIAVLHLDPPEGYDGPTNIYAELRRVRDVSAGRTECPKSSTQPDQGGRGTTPTDPDLGQPSDLHKQGVSAGRTECYFLDEGRPFLDDPCEKMDDLTPSDQAKPAPQVSSTSVSTNQPRTPGTHVASGTGSGGLVGGEEEGHDKAAAVLASLPVRTPLPASTVTALAPHVASLLASGWTAGELTEHLTAGLPPSYGVGLIVQRVRDTRPRTTTAEIMARQRAEAAAIRDCRLCDGEGFRYHPEGRHHGPTSERCNHQPVNGSDAPSASGNTCAEGAAPSATRDGAAETTLTVEQARLMIRQVLARSKSKSASHAHA